MSKNENLQNPRVMELVLHLTNAVNDHFEIENWEFERILTFTGKPRENWEIVQPILNERIKRLGFLPRFRLAKKKDDVRVEILPPQPIPKPSKIWINILAFITTIITTSHVGYIWWTQPEQPFASRIWTALFFSFSILVILGTHEMGHYLMARKYGLNATLPYFIPIPYTMTGTAGAVIKIKSPMPNRKVVFDVGIAGPLAGLVPTLIALIYGFTQVNIVQEDGLIEGSISFGDCLLTWLLDKWLVAPIPDGYTALANPIWFAGWFGILITMLNLAPIGQLDGGHVAYTILGKYHKYVAWGMLLILIGLSYFFIGWGVFTLMVLFIVKPIHPPPLDEVTPLDRKRKILAGILLVMYIFIFIPVPLVIH